MLVSGKPLNAIGPRLRSKAGEFTEFRWLSCDRGARLVNSVVVAVVERDQHYVGEVGLEPTRPCEHGLLRPACLPISALAQAAEEREGFEPSKGLLL